MTAMMAAVAGRGGRLTWVKPLRRAGAKLSV